MEIDESGAEVCIACAPGESCRRLKQYVYILRSEMSIPDHVEDDKRVYMHEVDDTVVVKVLKDDYEGRKMAEQLREYVEEYLVDDDGS